MRIILFFYILLNTCLSQSWAKGIMLYVHNDKNVKQPYLYELEKEMQNYDIDMIVYPVDVSRTDTAIVALITLSGAFCNGDDYFYNETSITKNMKMLDSVSFDNQKEQNLRMGALYVVKYIEPQSYNYDNISSEIVKNRPLCLVLKNITI